MLRCSATIPSTALCVPSETTNSPSDATSSSRARHEINVLPLQLLHEHIWHSSVVRYRAIPSAKINGTSLTVEPPTHLASQHTTWRILPIPVHTFARTCALEDDDLAAFADRFPCEGTETAERAFGGVAEGLDGVHVLPVAVVGEPAESLERGVRHVFVVAEMVAMGER